MGKKQTLLTKWLNGTTEGLPEISIADLLGSEFREDIENIFSLLGGKDITCSKPGGYDMLIPSEEIIVELDEHQHFNRYRLTTLSSKLYDSIPHFPLAEYRRFCNEYEKKCPARLGWWSNAGANKLFGQPSPDGNHSGNGSTRWKQRAFYDYLKDLGQLIHGVPVIRISVYETIEVNDSLVTLEKVLSNPIEEGRDSVRQLVMARASLSKRGK
ncbi:MAG: hypothetical protein GX382_09070 [Syntrophomonadaceae bacterium]|nr:hypothetical protein [Bacillota bacterium]NLP24653.1 hypothetical protein [Syntrophomonadaceae bacterium]